MTYDVPPLGCRPLPVWLGDAAGSTWAIMRFPDDRDRARVWHAQFLSRGPLPNYLLAGNDLGDGLREYFSSVAPATVDDKQARERERIGQTVGEVVVVLWAMIENDSENASWGAAIREVARAHACSEALIRGHMKLMGPVLHLWCVEQLHETNWPGTRQEFDQYRAESLVVLTTLRNWQRARPVYLGGQASYLDDEAYALWEHWQPPNDVCVQIPQVDASLISVRKRQGRPPKPMQT